MVVFNVVMICMYGLIFMVLEDSIKMIFLWCFITFPFNTTVEHEPWPPTSILYNVYINIQYTILLISFSASFNNCILN